MGDLYKWEEGRGERKGRNFNCSIVLLHALHECLHGG